MKVAINALIRIASGSRQICSPWILWSSNPFDPIFWNSSRLFFSLRSEYSRKTSGVVSFDRIRDKFISSIERILSLPSSSSFSLSLSRVERARTSSRVTLNFLARPPKTARFIVLGLEYDSLALFWHNSTDARFFFFFRPISDRGNKDRPRIVIRSRWKSHVFLCRVYKEHSCIVYY